MKLKTASLSATVDRVLSYAQNAEDVVLERLFCRQQLGRYVDIGANHPIIDSVTKHFSLRGWTGVNVEPLPDLYELLCADRPADTNLCAAVSDVPGSATLFAFPNDFNGLSTLSADISREHGLDMCRCGFVR